MAGMMLAAAGHRIAIVIDGFISTAAAAVACALAPNARDYMFAGHRSQEPGHRILLERLALRPILDLEIIVENSIYIYNFEFELLNRFKY